MPPREMKPSANISTSSKSTNSGPESQKSQESFKALKEICVPLLSKSLLTTENIPQVSSLLSQLWSCLDSLPESQRTLSPATISYVFFPLSHILQRNASPSIPDVIMEKLMDVLATLFEQWWWTCPADVWEQVMLLSAAIIGGVGAGGDSKGKTKARDDETKRAAAKCLWSVLRRRRGSSDETDSSYSRSSVRAEEQFTEFQTRSRATRLLPVLGQTLTSLLETAQSVNRELQKTSLNVVDAMITDYLPGAFMPSILPGVISAMAKVALGRREDKGWSNGDRVSLALQIMQKTIVRAIGDEVCQDEGAIPIISGLEDLAEGFGPDGEPRPVILPSQEPKSPFFTPRTSVWLAASAAQLHIALNSLSPLMSHPNPVALEALSQFSRTVAANTYQTLPDTQPLLLSFLLSLSTSSFPNVAETSHDNLIILLSPPSATRFTLLQIMMRTTQENLSALPRLLPSHSDAKVEHLARQISAVCRLSKDIHAVSDGMGKLLGPGGGIEKWGWGLLSVLELSEPALFVSNMQPSQPLLEGAPESIAVHPFPAVQMKHVVSLDTRDELVRMFRALGAAAGPECLFSVEWFVGVARRGRGTKEVAALWCASRVLEGVGGVSLDRVEGLPEPSKKEVEKGARWIARTVAEFWDQDNEDEEAEFASRTNSTAVDNADDGHLPLEYVKGLEPLITRFDFNNNKFSQKPLQSQRILHSVLSLQLLSVTSCILRIQFLRLLLYTLYPVLRSLVSENAYLSTTALAALHLITATTAYASPSNLLLANFDYALDGVSRRLDRRHLDPEATKILVVLVRLVGKDIVSRARDVVEACFDRLDEFHGYNELVEGLVEVLAEVVNVVEAEEDPREFKDAAADESSSKDPAEHMESFLHWYQHRHDRDTEDEDQEDYGPVPQTAWGPGVGKGKEKEVVEEETALPTDSNDATKEPLPTPTQLLTQQIVSRSIYFITHPSPFIRARILSLLEMACPTLSESNLLPSIHTAWPYILNRLADSEPFVVSAAASLIASLAEHVGEFMTTRIWNDVWPRFRTILAKLEAVDAHSALARRDLGAVGTESAYSISHRLYTSLMRTMRTVIKRTRLRHDILWEVMVSFRRFLHIGAHEELQLHAREIYSALMDDNRDVVWLLLCATVGKDIVGSYDGGFVSLGFLANNRWDIEANARIILRLQ